MKHLFMMAAALLLHSCTQSAGSGKDRIAGMVFPKGYDDKAMKTVVLEPELDEISGIAWDATRGQLLAEEDESGDIYLLDKEYRIRQKLPFAQRGDYEDIVWTEDRIYVLRSDGTIFAMNYDGQAVSSPVTYEYTGKKAEFESLLWDKDEGRLLLVAKSAGKGKKESKGKKERATPVVALDTATGAFSEEPVHILSWDAIGEKAGHELKSFNPSGAAVHPVNDDIYLLSSMQKLLVVCNSRWEVQQVTALDPEQFRQPEGMTFDTEGNLYIVSEAAGREPILHLLSFQP